jgi:RNA-directed DNA polymerase
MVNFKEWFKKSCSLPKAVLFAKLNRKLLGYYNYYGITGNSQSLSAFVYSVTKLLYKWLNRRSQRKSYNWMGFGELLNHFGIIKPRIFHAL